MAVVYSVIRYAKTKSVTVGSYDTEAEAKAAMVEHFSSTPKRGKFYYRICQEELKEAGGVMFRCFASDSPTWRYTREQLEAMVCTT